MHRSARERLRIRTIQAREGSFYRQYDVLKRFRGICSTCPSKMDIRFDVLLETFDQKLTFVVYFGEERQVRLGPTKSERTRLVSLL